ncbi:MAG: LLM class flavin-dependent oxidoreductase, partial [Jeotgalicoccus sp.]
EELTEFSESYQVDEFMIVTITHNIEDKLNSYRLLADCLLK